MLININKIQIYSIRQFAVIVTFVMSFGIFGMHAQAHTPHDMISAFAASPNYATDKTMFAVTDGAYTGWR
ncbi:hypothetical protein, partial [Nitrosomonas supralitoralis]